MKSFQRVKRINGKDYAYLITPYYDRKLKRMRQKSAYIGRYENGKIVRPSKLPKNVLSYGEFLPLVKAYNDLGIESILAGLCSTGDASAVRLLSMNRNTRPLSLQNIRSWAEGTTIWKETPCACSSQSMSNFLARIGSSSVPERFISAFISSHKDRDCVAMDITSLSSYSTLNNLLEYGYSRDKDDLPQFNLSFAVGKKDGVPLMYDIYPGSINDVSTVSNSIRKMKSCGLEVSALVFDRGFFSEPNVTELWEEKIPFILGVPLKVKEAKELLSSVHLGMEDPENMHMHEGKPVFVREERMQIGDNLFKAFVYYDINLEQKEKTSFYTRLDKAKRELEGVKLRKWMNPESVFVKIAGRMKQYLSYSVSENGFSVSVRKNAVSQRVNRMGKTILLVNGDFRWDECLCNYRQKDVVEKNFMVLKSSMLQSPLYSQKPECVRGWVFILFISLMVRFLVQKRMRDSGLNKSMSYEAVMLELEKLKKVELMNGDIITTEVTKTQREILEKFGLCA